MKSAYVFLADGFEDVEAVTPIDYLRRAGIETVAVGVTGITVRSSHQVSIVCDASLDSLRSAPFPDLIVFPGGMKGAENLASSASLRDFTARFFAAKKHVGAICAAPAVVLGAWGHLSGRIWTCYPGCEGSLDVRPSGARVVTDGNLTTARGPGAAEEFSLELIGIICGREKAAEVAAGILARPFGNESAT